MTEENAPVYRPPWATDGLYGAKKKPRFPVLEAHVHDPEESESSVDSSPNNSPVTLTRSILLQQKQTLSSQIEPLDPVMNHLQSLVSKFNVPDLAPPGSKGESDPSYTDLNELDFSASAGKVTPLPITADGVLTEKDTTTSPDQSAPASRDKGLPTKPSQKWCNWDVSSGSVVPKRVGTNPWGRTDLTERWNVAFRAMTAVNAFQKAGKDRRAKHATENGEAKTGGEEEASDSVVAPTKESTADIYKLDLDEYNRLVQTDNSDQLHVSFTRMCISVEDESQDGFFVAFLKDHFSFHTGQVSRQLTPQDLQTLVRMKSLYDGVIQDSKTKLAFPIEPQNFWKQVLAHESCIKRVNFLWCISPIALHGFMSRSDAAAMLAPDAVPIHTLFFRLSLTAPDSLILVVKLDGDSRASVSHDTISPGGSTGNDVATKVVQSVVKLETPESFADFLSKRQSYCKFVFSGKETGGATEGGEHKPMLVSQLLNTIQDDLYRQKIHTGWKVEVKTLFHVDTMIP
eukprot:CAMPEP_0175131294 /NCGR_PEP_ID=MMETSP0087-20121206/6463_1 /TAXON_ID=136419 /ORGANISM="Unknown Unknown, Strain D1" /LENGTH=513 /DNA_ID=CAMNT_0016413569 /DNA_START=168 /DNA_END=1709 /DNA_ORIENTATION=-